MLLFLQKKKTLVSLAARHRPGPGAVLPARALAAMLTAVPAAAQAEDPVVAMRGTDQITLSEARTLLGGADAQTRQRLAKDPAAFRQALRDVLLQRALLRQAAAEKWADRPEVAALLQKARTEIIVQTYLAGHAAIPADYPANSDIQAAYDANKPRFMQPRGYHLAQVFLPQAAGVSAEEAARRLLPARSALLRPKADVQAASRGIAGAQAMDMGWAPETQLVPAIRSAVQGLPEGGVTDPVCIENGCHVIKLVATRPAAPAPLNQVRDQLVQALRRQKQTQAETAYASHLLEQQPVEINEIQLAHLAP